MTSYLHPSRSRPDAACPRIPALNVEQLCRADRSPRGGTVRHLSFRQFFQTVLDDLIHAARLDGLCELFPVAHNAAARFRQSWCSMLCRMRTCCADRCDSHSTRSRKRPIHYDKAVYRQRQRIENMFARFKPWRIATAMIDAHTPFFRDLPCCYRHFLPPTMSPALEYHAAAHPSSSGRSSATGIYRSACD